MRLFQIHTGMSGRIKLLENGASNSVDDPPIPHDYETVSGFDATCGTAGLNDYVLPNPACPETFVCGENMSPELKLYADCTNAMNCKMFTGMTHGVSTSSIPTLFMTQMIPHHENAINMAKSLLKTGKLPCDDLLDEESPYCIMKSIMLEIVSTQNSQIQTMKALLERRGEAAQTCHVDILSSEIVNGVRRQ